MYDQYKSQALIFHAISRKIGYNPPIQMTDATGATSIEERYPD